MTNVTLTAIKAAARKPEFFGLFARNPKLADSLAHLDRLSNACTAFRTFSAFCAALKTGYVPTIYPDSRRKVLLTRAVLAAGYPVYDGSQVRRPA